MKNVVTKRFVECHDELKKEKKIKSSRQFALSLDYLPQSLSEILKGRRDVTLELLRKATEMYNINPNYLFLGEGPKFFGNYGQKKGYYSTKSDTAENPCNSKNANDGYFKNSIGSADVKKMIAPANPVLFYMAVDAEKKNPTKNLGDIVLCSHFDLGLHAIHSWDGALVGKRILDKLEVFILRVDQTSDLDFFLWKGVGSPLIKIDVHLLSSLYLIHFFLKNDHIGNYQGALI